jgi:hypothetical protein
VSHDPDQPSRADGNEPDDHDRTEDPADAGRASALEQEEQQQRDHGQPDDGRLEGQRDHFQPLIGREHGNRRGDDGVAVKSGRADHHGGGEDPEAP